VNRDPIEEKGGANLYRFVGNNPCDDIDDVGFGYGNPVCDASGPVGPSDPYASGGLYYPDGAYFVPQVSPPFSLPFDGAFFIAGWQSPKSVDGAKPEFMLFGGKNDKHGWNGGGLGGLSVKPAGWTPDMTLAGEYTYSQRGGFHSSGIEIFDVHSPIPRFPIGAGVFINNEGEIGVYFYGFTPGGFFLGGGLDYNPCK
jgi:hypothetical protein